MWKKIFYVLLAVLNLSVLILTQKIIDDDISDEEIKKIVDSMSQRQHKNTSKILFNLIDNPDDTFLDSQEGLIDIGDQGVRTRWVGSLVGKVTSATIQGIIRSISQAAKIAIKAMIKGLKSALKFIANVVKKSAKKVWGYLKSKKGSFKKAARELMEEILMDAYEEGKVRAIEYFNAMLFDYLDIQGGGCQCPVEVEDKTNKSLLNSAKRKCKCCLKFPRLRTGCIIVNARPREGRMLITLKYNGTEFLKSQITDEGSGKCNKELTDMQRKVCAPLPDELHFLNVCITPGNLVHEDDDNFYGCFTITQDRLQLSFERCMIYRKQKFEDGSFVDMFSPEDILTEEELNEMNKN